LHLFIDDDVTVDAFIVVYYALRSLSRAFHFQKFIVNKVPLGAL